MSAAETTAPVFKPIRSTSAEGALNIVRPSKLAKEGFVGTVAEGIYEGAVPNKYDATKLDYKIRSANGDLTIINSTGSLTRQMAMVSEGTLVQINYGGKVAGKGKSAGKSFHNFEVLTA